MRINNNLMAMNTHRQLGINGTNTQKSIEKLSSGMRINKAGDDAAGLAISEKMRGQIRGLNQASRNAQDGISLVQTAEGALSESQSILQRMRELAVQAGNDTNTDVDRGEIQKEMNQLTSEINRIGNTTEFNTQKVLNGGADAVGEVGSITVTTASDAGAATGAASVTETTASIKAGTGAVSIAQTTASIDGASATGTTDFGGTTGNVTATGPENDTYNGYDIIFTKSGTADDALAASINTGTKEITVTWGDNNNPANMAAVNAAIKAATDAEGTLTGDITLSEAGTFAEADLTGKTITLDNSGVAEQAGVFSLTIDTAFTDGDEITVGGNTYTYQSDGSGDFDGADANAQAAALATAIGGETRFDAGSTTALNNVITITEAAGEATGVAVAASANPVTEQVGVFSLTIDTAFADGDTITIDGNSYEYQSDGSGDFDGADANAQATALATLIGGTARFDAGSTTAAANVITITEAAGQATGVTLADPTIAGPGATLGEYTVDITTNLAAGESITIGSVTLTEGTDFTAGADVNATSTAIAAALQTEGTYTATSAVDSATITINETTASGTDLTDSDISVAGAGGGNFTATLQIGASQSQSFGVEISDMRASELGISGAAEGIAEGTGAEVVAGATFAAVADTDELTDNSGSTEYALDVSTNEKASAAIKVLDQAMTKVSSERSKLGAYQNRLEHTIRNLDASSENLVAAESRIRDVDMAKEMMEFTKNNILQQAAQSMLAQANQQPQGVLQLLR